MVFVEEVLIYILVAEGSDPLDSDFDDRSGFHGAHPHGCSAADDVASIECHIL